MVMDPDDERRVRHVIAKNHGMRWDPTWHPIPQCRQRTPACFMFNVYKMGAVGHLHAVCLKKMRSWSFRVVELMTTVPCNLCDETSTRYRVLQGC